MPPLDKISSFPIKSPDLQVANTVRILRNGHPIVVKMLKDVNTLKKGEYYILFFDSQARAFDLQGYDSTLARYNLARHTNGDLDKGIVSLWGTPAHLKAGAFGSGLTLHLNKQDPFGVARVETTIDTNQLEQACTSFFSSLSTNWLLAAANQSGAVLTDELMRHTGECNYERLRFVASSGLEPLGLFLRFVYRADLWTAASNMISRYCDYLNTSVDVNGALYGIVSDYAQVHNRPPQEDSQTAYTILRAFFATDEMCGTALFPDIATVFMRDARSELDWGFDSPNGAMQIASVFSRCVARGLEPDSNFQSIEQQLLRPTLERQITDQGQWLNGKSLGFGGWCHSYAQAKKYQHQPHDFADNYKQWLSYHEYVVRGLAESYRILSELDLLNSYNWFSTNLPYNLMAALSWICQLARADGSIADRWKIDEIDPEQRDATIKGICSIIEILRTIDVEKYLPYYLNYPSADSQRSMSAEYLKRTLTRAVEYAGRAFGAAYIEYGAAVLGRAYRRIRPAYY